MSEGECPTFVFEHRFEFGFYSWMNFALILYHSIQIIVNHTYHVRSILYGMIFAFLVNIQLNPTGAGE
jgi:hypothetical protein